MSDTPTPNGMKGGLTPTRSSETPNGLINTMTHQKQDNTKSTIVRLWRWIWPRKEWMIVWGCGFAHWKPRKELRWFWLGEPCSIMIDGCGPFTADEIDNKLASFLRCVRRITPIK